MSQPTEKRADQLKIGDYIHDGRGIGPVEITHVQPHRNAHGDQRVLIVTDDAAVSWHPVDQMFALATDAERAAANAARERAQVVARIREMADWAEQHPDLPAPSSVRLVMQHSMIHGSDEEKLAVAARVAELLGGTVGTRPGQDGYDASVRVEHEVGDYHTGEMRYVFHAFLDALPAALAPETPLDELPADFGADHDPDECECDDCVAEAIDAAEAAAEADAADEPATVPVYADSVNGEEL